MMNIPLGDFERGPLAAPSFDVGGERVAPNICYEDLFGEELAARFVPEASAPTILANLSNIGWFGRTIAVEQHLRISRMRSLELQRPMIRATNTGATVVIDHRGVVTHALPPFSVGILEGTRRGSAGPDAVRNLGQPPWALATRRSRAASCCRLSASRRPLKSCGCRRRRAQPNAVDDNNQAPDALVPATHPAPAVVLGRARLRAAAALRHGGRRRHEPHRDVPARARAPSRGRWRTCSRAGARRTVATATTRTACSTTTSTRSC